MRRSELKTEKLKENDSNYILNSLKKHGISYDINEIDQIILKNSFENNYDFFNETNISVIL